MNTTIEQRLRDEKPGLVGIGPSREAYWTGKVAVGLRHGEPLRAEVPRRVSQYLPPVSADEERIQTALRHEPTPMDRFERTLDWLNRRWWAVMFLIAGSGLLLRALKGL
jgi:hypothetical protein